jgi:hypothetical protein
MKEKRKKERSREWRIIMEHCHDELQDEFYEYVGTSSVNW